MLMESMMTTNEYAPEFPAVEAAAMTKPARRGKAAPAPATGKDGNSDANDRQAGGRAKAAAASPASDPRPVKVKREATEAQQAKDTKADLVLKKLRMARGATVAQIMEATGWQAHSVRGFLSAVVKKKLGLNLTSEVGKDGQRRYRVVEAGEGASGQAS